MLCAVKHIAQARVLIIEANKGYPQHYFFCLGHLAEAEDELVTDHPALCSMVRGVRKMLENNKDTKVDWSWLVLTIAERGEQEVQSAVERVEAEVTGASVDDLRSWFQTIKG